MLLMLAVVEEEHIVLDLLVQVEQEEVVPELITTQQQLLEHLILEAVVEAVAGQDLQLAQVEQEDRELLY
jgi:hypothetical protein